MNDNEPKKTVYIETTNLSVDANSGRHDSNKKMHESTVEDHHLIEAVKPVEKIHNGRIDISGNVAEHNDVAAPAKD